VAVSEELLVKDRHHIRPKETDLLALLESRELDYVFIYRSVAEQHGLEYLLLPDEINLKQPELKELYARVSVEISGRSPGSTIVKQGEPMVYGLTIPRAAPNRQMALEFVRFILSERGQAIMQENGQGSLVPSPSTTFDHLPLTLQEFALPSTQNK
jgi:molybdate/tungstate transport system substrate-binding protein